MILKFFLFTHRTRSISSIPRWHRHQDRAQRQRLPVVQRPGLGEKAVDHQRHGRTFRAADQGSGSKLSQRDGKGKHRRHDQGPPHQRQVDIAQHLPGTAPSTAAAWRRRGWMLRRAGVRLRTTKGKATSLWARGISAGEARRSSGGRLRATINPRPRVTAEVPIGSISSGSRNRLSDLRCAGPAPRRREAQRQRVSTVAAAYPRELAMPPPVGDEHRIPESSHRAR